MIECCETIHGASDMLDGRWFPSKVCCKELDTEMKEWFAWAATKVEVPWETAPEASVDLPKLLRQLRAVGMAC